MMLHKRLVYGLNGYQVLPTPRATRSPRKRRRPRSKTNENQMCPFDLLATVADNLSLEGNNYCTDALNNKKQSSSLKDSIKKEDHNVDKPLNGELSRSGVCRKNFPVSDVVKKSHVLNNCSKEHLHALEDAGSRPVSVISTSDDSVKIGSPEQIVSDGDKFLLGSSTRIAGSELYVSKVSASCKLDYENKTHLQNEFSDKGKMPLRNMTIMSNSNCLESGKRNPSLLIASDCTVKFPFNKDNISSGSFPVMEGVKLSTRDDDENSCCTQPSTINKAFRPFNRDRITNSVSSHCWKVDPATKDGRHTINADMDRRQFPQDKIINKHQRPLRDYPIKKRKLYGYSSISNFNGGTNETGALASSAVERASLQYHVKLKIKSFRVPELFIEIPETATIGSLQKTVMEAVTAILGDGLQVGVLLQGKKIRDDNRTLLQAGISHNSKADALGFMLEPNLSPAPVSVYAKDNSFLQYCESPKPLQRYTGAQNLFHDSVQHKAATMSTNMPRPNLTNFVKSDHDSAPSPDISQEKSVANSRALVAAPPKSAEVLSIVPMRKPKRSESAQRRIRRPFTVSEVEALVQAVEKLGTGRWRDVKLRAFDNAKHRTYVDLKDKWKTLVHTARISRQQRRGEPVPQELLDRVLLAQVYWSKQQAKLQPIQHSELAFSES